MNINAAIVDQQITKVMETIRERAANELNIRNDDMLKSLAFVFLCVKTALDLDDVEAFDCLVEGGQDFGVDAIHISNEYRGELTISLFQGKYKRNLKGDSHFPENGIVKLVNAIKYIFNPNAILENINERLRTKVEEARSLISDGHIPQIKVLACNNGLQWNSSAQDEIDRANEEGFKDQVAWCHVNHDNIVQVLQGTKKVDDKLQLSGKAVVEDMNFSRVLIGRIAVEEIHALMKRHGERLLDRNIRRYLGLQTNRVNKEIYETLKSSHRANFYFYNNGITLTCDKFSYNALQSGDYIVNVENLQIINGGQTCMTIYEALENPSLLASSEAYVLIRLYQLPSNDENLVHQITFATNSQNPVDLRDLKSNHEKQIQLETDIAQLGYSYKRKRSDSSLRSTEITSGVAAESILSVWRRRPHQAKYFSREHFGKLYDIIFSKNLNGSQTILATIIHRYSENKRKRPPQDAPTFLRYASCFISMQMGKYLLKEMNLNVSGVNHQTFKDAMTIFEKNKERFFQTALSDIEKALEELYGDSSISLQQLAATFRRGDLIGILDKQENNEIH